MRFPHSPRSRHPWTTPVLFLLALAAVAALALHPAASQEPENAKIVPSPTAPAPPPAQPAPAPQQPAPQPPAQQPAAPAQQPAAPPPPPPAAPAQAAPAPPSAQAAPAPPSAQAAPAPPSAQAAPAPPSAQAAPAPPSAQAAPAPPSAQAAPAPPPPAAPAPAAAPRPTPASTAGSAAASSAGSAQPVGPLFGETIEVRVVNVEAVVTDKKGNRVPDLKPEDFRLKVDGKQIKIDFFNEVRGGQAIAPEAGATATVPGLPDLAPGSPVGTSYLVFIDDYFSVAANRDQVLKSLRDDLSRMGPEDRMALVAFDGKHLNLLSSWSSSSRELSRAIEREIGGPAHGLERQVELQNFRVGAPGRISPDPGHPALSATDSQLRVDERTYALELGSQLERAVAAATSTLRGFASPPGRKVMLLLVGGWPFSLTDYVVNDINRPILDHDVPEGGKLLRPLIETANRLGYTLYPIDVPGIEANATSATRTGPRQPGTGFNLREQEHEGTLTFIAKETGGKALINSLRIGSLEHVVADTRSYYWFGFSPNWQGNDKKHDIQLEVLRPGLSVRTRDSFLDRSRKAEVSMMVESAMMFGSAPGAPSMPVQLGKPARKSRSEMEVPVTLAIPTSAFTTVPLNGKFAAELELRVAAQDDHGNKSDIPVIPLQLQSDKQPLPGRFVRYETKLSLRRTSQHLVFAIFDPLSNKITTAEADVKPD